MKGEGDWDGKPVENLRSVFSVHTETVLLVTRAGTNITTVEGIKGHSVNLGVPGSGARVNAEQVLRLYGIDVEKDIRPDGLQQSEANQALIEGRIDAFFYTVGNPATAIEDVAKATDIVIVPIDSQAVRDFVAANPDYVMTEVPGGLYPGVGATVATYGVAVTVVTRAEMSDDAVYDFTAAMFDNLDEFRESWPVFESLTSAEMLQGLTAPMHPGAQAQFEQHGLM